jgi:CheY-like chemotaxis protein
VQQAEVAAPTPSDMDLRVQRVLVCDDNADAGDTLAALLRLLGAEVRIARDGIEALAVLEEYAPTVAILDIGMPGMNGYEVARTIRTRMPDVGIKLVALTGWAQDADRKRALDAGFDHHMVKPPNIGGLQALRAD